MEIGSGNLNCVTILVWELAQGTDDVAKFICGNQLRKLMLRNNSGVGIDSGNWWWSTIHMWELANGIIAVVQFTSGNWHGELMMQYNSDVGIGQGIIAVVQFWCGIHRELML